MYSNYIKTGILLFCAVFVLQTNAQEGVSVNKRIKFTKEVSPTQAKAQFLQKFNLDENNTFQQTIVNKDRSGMQHEKMQQYYNGIKVEFGTLIVHSKNNTVKNINGEVYNGNGVNLSPTLSPQEAFNKATAFVGAQQYLWSNPAEAAAINYSKPTGELVLLPEMDTYSGMLNLAYKFDIYATQPVSRGEVYVDAQNGNILFNNKIIKHYYNEGREMLNDPANLVSRKEAMGPFVLGSANTRYSGLRGIETRLETSGMYTLNDDGRSVFTRNAQNVPFGGGYINNFAEFTDADNVWTLPGLDDAALDAHWGAMQSYDYWLNVHGRNGIDGNGFSMRSYVHVANPQGGGSWVNAAWNGSVMSYGDGNGSSFQPLTSIDICGHEIGHGITQFANNLVYARESGALNEGYSDIWGAAIEFYAKGNGDDLNPNAETWQIGEDFVSNGIGIRSMSNPNQFGDPDTYEGSNWRPTSATGCPTPNNSNDQCGVHSNSGVLNFWFYLLTQGGSGTNDAFNAFNVTGIGMQKSEEIAYLVLRDYLTPNSTFLDARNAAVDIALSLYGSNSPEAIATQDAFYAVNVGAPYVAQATDGRLVSVSDPEIHCGLNTYSPRVKVENAGVATPITSVDINYSIDGGSTNTFTFNGNIPVGATQDIDLPAITLTKGLHALSFSIVVVNDGNATNNQEGFALRVNEIGTVQDVYDFETISDDLLTYFDGVPQTWSRGTYNQTGSVFATTTLSGNVYATNLNGNYFQNTRSYLVTDCYDLVGVVNPTIQFDMAFDIEENWDYLYVEYSTNGGNDWNVLGSASDANWYNSDRTFASSGNTDCFACIGSQWTGTDATMQQYSYNLAAFNSEPSIVFRFVLVTDAGTNNEGPIIDNLTVTSVLSVGDVENNNAFSIYPNPSNGSFSIKAAKNLGDVSVHIFDINGRNLYSKDVNLTGTVNFDLDNLQSGLYILRVAGEDFVKSTKIIIE
ncbi:Thermostable neutral protease NprT [Kordia antarctica]|uniref:Thermostable neutral protease NprT n=1 Tax=Kordia antarctica TaxID=1218801 RepID=A0A7L4ZL96_9FLAO|nr:M4 family metallopeptidase [Kordia antarctica]QHI37300.1 Thermostable neutral protease NprT [Kordia antarctica]